MTVAAVAAKLHEFRQWWQQPGHEITRTEAWVRTTKDSSWFLGTVRFGNDHVAEILGFDDLQWGNILITRVYFVEGLGHNLFSVGKFCASDLKTIQLIQGRHRIHLESMAKTTIEWVLCYPQKAFHRELPSLAEDPDGYKVVSEFMLYGPCGKDAKYAPCTTEGKCSKHYPKVFLAETLNYHLPNQNSVTLRDYENLSALLEREGINITMFTDWFELNKRDTDAREFTYADTTKLCVAHTTETLEAKETENCIGAKYFEELMTINKQTYTTFKAACFAYGLLNDDKEWSHAIAEARF
ncbi:hypothetical protein Tco_1508320 [Tanacetum coccineum]